MRALARAPSGTLMPVTPSSLSRAAFSSTFVGSLPRGGCSSTSRGRVLLDERAAQGRALRERQRLDAVFLLQRLEPHLGPHRGRRASRGRA